MTRVTIDVGGTFTDCLVLDQHGTSRAFKSQTTPEDPTVGLTNVLDKAAKFFDMTLPQFLSDVELLIAHGTTLSTNALLTGRIAKVGLLTTEGFRDTLQIRRGYKNIHTTRFNLFVPPYRPLVPRYLRLGIRERTLCTGDIETALSEEDVYKAILRLRQENVEAAAICFLHSCINSTNERRAAEICRREMTEAYVTASHEVLPVFREFERFSTTVVSAAVGPITKQYLGTLTKKLGDLGFKGTLYMVQGGGMIQSVEESAHRAVSLIGSGPAAAPAAAIRLGKSIGSDNLFSVDMGGTSYDVCLIRNGAIPTTDMNWVGEELVAMKLVDVPSIGAGGGSIAWINTLGLLQVGPQSAGAEPGPACYGKGGKDPTTTDADLVLGFIPADYFLSGEIVLKEDLAGAAIRKVAQPLGLEVPQAAHAIFATVNAVMADKMTEISTKRGYDIRDFVLVVGGGAGPVHGGHLAELLQIPKVIIPRFAATYSAFGMLHMEVGRDFARSIISRRSLLDFERINQLFAEMENEAGQVLGKFAIGHDDIVLRRSLEMRYLGQFHEVLVTDVPLGKIGSSQMDAIVNAFHRRHKELYTFEMPEREVEFLNAGVKAAARRQPLPLAQVPRAEAPVEECLKRRRFVLWDLAQGYQDTPVFDGERLGAGHRIIGPALIEEPATTVVVPASYECMVDDVKNYVLTRR
ncbi:MAG: hydantoinase/oxoprolinase family protein [Xanthobacteraceae bacterium]